MTLLEMVRKYQELLTEKDRLSDLTKENNAAIEAAKAEIAQQMVDDDCPKISVGEFTFSLTAKVSFSKRSEEDMAASGVNFFEVLREEGFGDLIVETVNPRTLQSAMKAYVDECGELSEGLNSIIRIYEFNDISRRKETRKIGGAKK